MNHVDPAKLIIEDLGKEIIEVTNELVKTGERPTETSPFERFEWAAGFSLNLAGLVAGGPLTPIGLGLFGVGTGLLIYSIARRLTRQTGDIERIARIDFLKVRLYALQRELRRRTGQAPP